MLELSDGTTESSVLAKLHVFETLLNENPTQSGAFASHTNIQSFTLDTFEIVASPPDIAVD
jgi:hypothetical protein